MRNLPNREERMMGYCRFFLMMMICYFVTGTLVAQFYDDFSAGTFAAGGWQGDTTHFRFSSSSAVPATQHPAVQLFATGAGVSHIYVHHPWHNMLEWSAWFKLSFRPSVNNFARFYLTSGATFDDSSLFVGIGMEARRVGLYRHEGQTVVPLVEDTLFPLDATVNEIRFRVVMVDGWWHLLLDPTGGHNLLQVDSALWPLHSGVVAAGIWCQYTSSNATKVYVDDVACGPLTRDTIPPSLVNLWLNNPTQITLQFSEPVQESSIHAKQAFGVTPQLMYPLLCIPDPAHPAQYSLHYPNPFPDGADLVLSIKGVTDPAGNIMPDTTIRFIWYTAKRNDLLINEVMADPSPPVQLPESEYIELFNNSESPVSLCDWVLWIDNTREKLPCMQINPGKYAIVIHVRDTALWSNYPGVITLPRLQLRNSNACIALQDYKGALVHAVCYDVSWHGTTHQGEGGWSLELRDPGNPCDQSGTWSSSSDMTGGTPGKPNSYPHPHPDLQAPGVLRVHLAGHDVIQITFTEPVDTTLNMVSLFRVEELDKPFAAAVPVPPLYRQMLLHLQDTLQPHMVYHLVQSDTLKDCIGNYSREARIPFGIPAPPDIGDLLFNEIMFSPGSYGEEYIEFFNNSGKIIDLSLCLLASIDTLTLEVGQYYPLADEPTLVFPGDYVVVTRNVEGLLSKHRDAVSARVIRAGKLPALPDQGGCYAIVGQFGTWTETMCYSPAMHAPGLSDTRGIALERIAAHMPATRPENWYSASAAAGFATPTNSNSQGYTSSAANGSVEVTPKWFNPNATHGEQLTYVSFHDIHPGTRAAVMVANDAGRIVRHLLRESVAANGDVIPWDGTCNNGLRCPEGIYVVCIFFYHPDTGQKRFKKPVVIIRR